MDQEMMARGGPELGMYACDRDLFERVWKRVMPEQRAGCPITVGPPVHTPEPVSMSGSGTPATPAAEPAPPCVPDRPAEPEPVPPEEPAPPDDPTPKPPEPDCPPPTPSEPDCPVPEPPPEDTAPPVPEPPESQQPCGDDFPRPDAVPCLGSGSASHGSQLQEDILTALEGWQLYRHLARKVTGNPARTLSALASEKHRQARRLAAAYFLISGLRYWPTDRLEVPRTNSWLGTLRRRFAAEQQLDSRWRAAALDTEDPCLAELYCELAEECTAHAGVLRRLLENAL